MMQIHDFFGSCDGPLQGFYLVGAESARGKGARAKLVEHFISEHLRNNCHPLEDEKEACQSYLANCAAGLLDHAIETRAHVRATISRSEFEEDEVDPLIVALDEEYDDTVYDVETLTYDEFADPGADKATPVLKILLNAKHLETIEDDIRKRFPYRTAA